MVQGEEEEHRAPKTDTDQSPREVARHLLPDGGTTWRPAYCCKLPWEKSKKLLFTPNKEGADGLDKESNRPSLVT